MKPSYVVKYYNSEEKLFTEKCPSWGAAHETFVTIAATGFPVWIKEIRENMSITISFANFHNL